MRIGASHHAYVLSIGGAFAEKGMMANKMASSNGMKVNNIAGSNAAVADAARGG